MAPADGTPGDVLADGTPDEAPAEGAAGDALADGTPDAPTKTGPSGGGTRDAAHAALLTTATTTSTPDNWRNQPRITAVIIANVNANRCPH